MCCHASLCALALLLGPLLWHSFALHTAFLAAVVAAAVRNGGAYYFRIFAKRYYQKPLEDEAKAAEAAAEADAVAAAAAGRKSFDYDCDDGGFHHLIAEISLITLTLYLYLYMQSICKYDRPSF